MLSSQVAPAFEVTKQRGITFDVAETFAASGGVRFSGRPSSDVEKTDGRSEIAIGDVAIRLEEVPGNPVTFEFNGDIDGTREIGNEVCIDKDRNVNVNGSERIADSGKAESERAA